jgi:hypothetical protein
MNSHQSDKDPIDEFLDYPLAEANDRLQLSVFAKTTRVLKRRRWLRRTGLVTGLGACYAAGILTVWLVTSPLTPWRAGSVSDRSERAASASERSDQKVAATRPSDSLPSPLPESALAMEWQALDSSEKRPELFRQAGDRYLEETNDVASAMRCYRGALEDASEEDLQISPDDNWLLIELKKDKQKEKRYAKNTHQ